MNIDLTLPDSGSPHAFVPGQLIAGRFAVVRFIARGGMGQVYEVEDRFLQNVHVALKTIAPEFAGDEASTRRFEQEVLLARKVTHPNLCPIYDIARASDPPPPFLFLTMKLLAGQTLSARLNQPGLIPPDEAVSIFTQLAAGLAALHAAGVIHRDIKPNNVMLDRSGPELCVCIMDFGLARLHDNDATLNGMQVSIYAGTPGYMAPEVLAGQGPSQAADLFALGVLMHRVLTGERPRFSSLTLAAEPTEALDRAPVPARFVHAVKEFLSNDPSRRAEAFAQLLAHSPQSSGAAARPLSRRQFAVGSALAAASIAGLAGWKWTGLYDLLHPLPAKRFVALVGWPAASDPRLAPAVSAVVDAIGSELARAEAFDRNLFVIPRHVGSDVASLAQIDTLRESVGANLVLSASAALAGDEVQLFLRVLDPATPRTLRERSIAVRLEDQLALPQRAVRAAASLLNIAKLELDDQRSAIGTSNSQAYAAFQKAEGLLAQQNDAGVEASIEPYKQAIDLDPGYALANARLARAYFRLYILHRNPGNLVLARSNCQAALAKQPSLVEGRLAFAQVLEWSGDKPGALREISAALAADPRNPLTLLLQGQEFTRLNRWSDAEDSFARLKAIRPNFWLAYEELGVALSDEPRYAQAAQEFRAAAILGARRTLPWGNLSAVLLAVGDIAGAADAARKCLALGPDAVGASRMAAVLRCQGKAGEALSFALKAVAINSDDAGNWMDLADTYALQKKHQPAERDAWEKSVQLLEDLVHTNDSDGPTWMSLALAQARTNRAEACIRSLTFADNNFAGDLDSQLMKLRILVLLGRLDDAFATASACLRRGATAFQFQCMPDMDALRKDSRFTALLPV